MLLGITIRGEILILKRKISFSLSASLSETPVAVTTDVAVAPVIDTATVVATATAGTWPRV